MTKNLNNSNEAGQLEPLVSGTFSNGEWFVNCKTVGELISELQRLPGNMPVNQGFSKSVDLVVFNRAQPDRHVSFDDGGDWTEGE